MYWTGIPRKMYKIQHQYERGQSEWFRNGGCLYFGWFPGDLSNTFQKAQTVNAMLYV